MLALPGTQPRKLTVAALALVVAAVLYLLFGINVSAREIVKGRVVLSGSVDNYVSPIDGYVEEVYVHPGQEVRKGQQLALVRHSRHTSEQGSDFMQLSENLARRTQLTLDKAQSLRSILSLERSQVRNKLQSNLKESAAIRQQIVLAEKASALHTKTVERTMAMVSQGFYSPAVGEEKERESVEIQLKKHELTKLLIGYESQRIDLEKQLIGYESKLKQIDVEAHIEHQFLQYQNAELGLKNSAVLVSTTDGVVDGLAVRVGDQVKEGQRVLAARSSDPEFHVELDVPTNAAGFLRVGQRIELRFDAFPYLKYGVGSGQIDHIGTTSAKAAPDLDNQADSYFRARASAILPPGLIGRGPYSVRDQMGVQIEVVVEEKLLFEWIFDPLLAVRRFVSAPGAGHEPH